MTAPAGLRKSPGNNNTTTAYYLQEKILHFLPFFNVENHRAFSSKNA